ncbi:cellulase family glycosylhydrolase [Clostridium sp. SHJSY1]|uniref:cellulase family glycosylhydrolase n=1 Tax=Clostridium sp. SHJSY1 TaxID=2942483 RepID=UPI0028755A30|nr:cellulase family glycosylhydrolase [Clostridium sp. SHJSY1]MDS0526259.1 cellulase family glycosylhydrolase [Clostridium sp. SHJSY1]
MKNTKKLLVFLVALVLLIPTCLICTPMVKTEAATKSKSQKYADAMEPGWNLGNSFDSFDTNGDRGEESWGNPIVTKELIKKIKSQGFKSIRMPFTTVMRTGAAPDYKIDSKFLNRYAEVVKWALDEGLYVMINIHHDSWSWANSIGTSGDNGASIAKYKAIWTQLSDYFKDYSDKVCFESLNEPQFTGDTANQIKTLEQVNTEFYNIVRNSGGKNATRMLVLPTLNTNDSDDKCESLYNTIEKCKDDNIMATFHYYGYWPFSVNIAGTTTMNDTVISELKNSFDRMYNHFTSKGIGTICGEYGLLAFDNNLNGIEHGEMLKYFEYVTYYAKQKNITMMLWDNGQHMGRTSLNWSDQSLYNIIKASWKTRSSYAESDRIFIKDETRNNNISIKLTSNGNNLNSIICGDKKLVLGKDYTRENDIVTIKGEYLNKLITDKYGVNATLTMRFSKGADWDIFVTHYKTPELDDGTVSASGFEIPVNFNGDRVTTLEAINSDGSGAGPQGWTTYKQFNEAFSVDYDKNKVTIKDKFFAEAKDGEITFKVHFQSGEILQCKLLKSGSEVKIIK